jgi:hypothetical protein
MRNLLKDFLSQGRRLKEIDKQEGHFGIKEGRIVFKIARSLKDFSVVVEIGAYKGKSTCFIAEGLRGSSSRLYSVDTWFNDGGMRQSRMDTFPDFLRNISPWSGKIIPLRGFSADIRKAWPFERKIDFLWIDGDHAYAGVKKDIEDWLPLVRGGCFVCFHDYREYPDVKRAVDEKIFEGRLRLVETKGNVLLAKKPITS